jgi:hypothetical protein
MARIPIFLMGLVVIWAALAEAEYMIYKEATKPLNSRIKDLMSRMTLEEKIGQMTQIERGVASAEVMKDYFIGKQSVTRAFTWFRNCYVMWLCCVGKLKNFVSFFARECTEWRRECSL